MAGLNKVFIMGNLGRTPEIKYTPSGTAICNFSLAVNRRWNDNDGNPQEEVEWFNVDVWGKTAENCANYLEKGSMAFIEGRIKTDEWTDDDGETQRRQKVVAQSVQFLSGQPEGEQTQQRAPQQQQQARPATQQAQGKIDINNLPY